MQSKKLKWMNGKNILLSFFLAFAPKLNWPFFRYQEKLRVHALRVMAVVEKTMHRLDSEQRAIEVFDAFFSITLCVYLN